MDMPVNPIQVRLPDSACATAERIAASIAALCDGLVVAEFHVPFVIAALRAAADRLEKQPIITPQPTLPPWNDPLDDAAVRSFKVGHLETDPRIGVLALDARSGRQFHFTFGIQDLRVMSDEMMREARKMAGLVAAEENRK